MAEKKKPTAKKAAPKKAAKPAKKVTKPKQTAAQKAHQEEHAGFSGKFLGFFKVIGRGIAHVLWHSKWGRRFTYVFIAWFISALALVTWYHIRHWDDKTELGVSYSLKYADELGIDWQDAFITLMDESGFKRFRLMSYWDLHEPEDDVFDFERLDWLFQEAEKRGAKINLAVGERQPRWPECHHPEWVVDLIGSERFNNELFEFIEVVVNRYKTSPALEQYQLENEYFNTLFGECPSSERDRLQAEYDLIKRLDPDRPVVINVSNQSGTPLREPVGDKVGFSVYFIAWGDWTGFGLYFRFWHVPPLWHTYRAAVIELVHGSETETFVHELQAEPWGPRATVDLTQEEQADSMTVDELAKRVRFAEQIGMSEIYLWGGEWYYWREQVYNDSSYLEEVKRLVDERPYQF